MTNLSGLFTPSPLITANAVSTLTANNALYLSGAAGNTYAQKAGPTFTGNTTTANLAVTGILGVTGNASITNTLTANAVSANGSVGSNGQLLTSNGSAVYWSTPPSGGLSEVDAWYFTSSSDGTSSNASRVLTAWARFPSPWSQVGTGVSQTSGVFSFPSTGVWEVYYQVYMNTSLGGFDASMRLSIDAGSTFNNVGYSKFSTGNGENGPLNMQSVVRITDISQARMDFLARGIVYGASVSSTYAIFKKLA